MSLLSFLLWALLPRAALAQDADAVNDSAGLRETLTDDATDAASDDPAAEPSQQLDPEQPIMTRPNSIRVAKTPLEFSFDRAPLNPFINSTGMLSATFYRGVPYLNVRELRDRLTAEGQVRSYGQDPTLCVLESTRPIKPQESTIQFKVKMFAWDKVETSLASHSRREYGDASQNTLTTWVDSEPGAALGANTNGFPSLFTNKANTSCTVLMFQDTSGRFKIECQLQSCDPTIGNFKSLFGKTNLAIRAAPSGDRSVAGSSSR